MPPALTAPLLSILSRQQRVYIDDETIEWVIATLKESHRDEKAYHDSQISRLQTEVRKLQGRLDAAYEDKLDGNTSEKFWQRRSREWRSRQLELQRSIEGHQNANQLYLDAGVNILRLSQQAYSLWLSQPQNPEKKAAKAATIKLHLRWRKAKHHIQKTLLLVGRRVAVFGMAGLTGLEPATSGLTGRHSKPTELQPHRS